MYEDEGEILDFHEDTFTDCYGNEVEHDFGRLWFTGESWAHNDRNMS